jgi:hypothetical protein
MDYPPKARGSLVGKINDIIVQSSRQREAYSQLGRDLEVQAYGSASGAASL